MNIAPTRRAWLVQAAAATAAFGGMAWGRSDAATSPSTPTTPLTPIGDQAGLTMLTQGVLIAGRATADALWVSDNRGQLYAADATGRNWRATGPRAQGAITALAFRGKQALAVGHRSTLLRSVDGGQRWAAVTLPARESVSLLDALIVSDQHALAFGAFGSFWRSADTGSSWQPAQAVPGDRHLNAGVALSDGTLLIVGEGGLILRSVDAGSTWSEVAAPTKASLFGVTTTAPGRVVACGLGGTVLQSTDFGLSWAAVTTDASVSWMSANAMSDGSVLLAGNQGSLAVLAPAASGELRIAQRRRQGYGTWSALLPCGTDKLLAVGETGLLYLGRKL